jgi:peptide/nickel transport system permease protein
LVALLGLSAFTVVALPDPNQQDLSLANSPPGTAGHVLGTDPLGRDLLAWIGSSVLVSLLIGLSVSLLSAIIGTAVGLAAGYIGGALDALLMRLVDLQLAVPPLLLFIAAAAVIRPSVLSLIILLTIPSWVTYARLVRTKVLTERERGYVAAARLAGTSRSRVLLEHLLPAATTLITVVFTLQVGYVLLWEAALSFLGIGIKPPVTSLGYMIGQGTANLVGTWWVAALPGATIVLLVLAFNLLGDGLRDVFRLDEGRAAP